MVLQSYGHDEVQVTVAFHRPDDAGGKVGVHVDHRGFVAACAHGVDEIAAVEADAQCAAAERFDGAFVVGASHGGAQTASSFAGASSKARRSMVKSL